MRFFTWVRSALYLALMVFLSFSEICLAQLQKGNGEMLQLKAGQVYVSVPRRFSPPYPAVLIVPDAAGTNPYYIAEADQFADLGYFAAVLDFQHGKIAKKEEELSEMTPDPNYVGIVFRGGISLLKSRTDVDQTKTAIISYGPTGQLIMKSMREADFGVGIFVSSPPPLDPNLFSGVRTSFYLINAENSPEIPRTFVAEFETMLGSLRINHESKFIKTDKRRWWDYSIEKGYDPKAGAVTRQSIVGYLTKSLVRGSMSQPLTPASTTSTTLPFSSAPPPPPPSAMPGNNPSGGSPAQPSDSAAGGAAPPPPPGWGAGEPPPSMNGTPPPAGIPPGAIPPGLPPGN